MVRRYLCVSLRDPGFGQPHPSASPGNGLKTPQLRFSQVGSEGLLPSPPTRVRKKNKPTLPGADGNGSDYSIITGQSKHAANLTFRFVSQGHNYLAGVQAAVRRNA